MSFSRGLLCLIEGESAPFRVKPTDGMDIIDLKELIKHKGVNPAKYTALAKDLALWKVDLELPSIDERKPITGKCVKGSLKLDRELEKVSALWPATSPPNPEHIHLIVELQSDYIMPLLSSASTATLTMEVRELWPAVIISALSQGDFGGDVLVRNRIFKLHGSELPTFLQDFQLELKRPRWIEPDAELGVLNRELNHQEFNRHFKKAPTDAGQRDRVCTDTELWHLGGAFLNGRWRDTNIKEANIHLDFDQIGRHFQSVFGPREQHAFRANWPFDLIVTTESEQTFRYSPRSDFYISVDRLVHVMVEVQSDRLQSDRTRMLLQAACAARLGYMAYGEPFVVIALYIEGTGQVTRYFVFQDNGNDNGHQKIRKVSYVSDVSVQDWTQPSVLFSAMFELYNLASKVQNDGRQAGNIQERIALLNFGLSNFFKETFMSKKRPHGDKGEGGTKRSRASHGGEEDQHGEHIYHDGQVIDAFNQAGYTFGLNGEDKDGWAPLNKLKPTMRHATESRGTDVVVKLLYPGSNELLILQHLHSIKSPYNHTIPLINAFELNVGTFIILPEATPLDLGFALGIHSKAVDFSRQLIDGVAFLHGYNIAHLDLKPQNIVTLQDRLLLIDFDISVFVDGPGALMDRWCGTPEWMAPEIGHGPYSPIRADLWSCGLVLRYIAGKGATNSFAKLTDELLNRNPQLRPLLYLGDGGSNRKSGSLSHVAKRPIRVPHY